MSQHETGADLQQFVCEMQWMRAAIPEFSSIIRPLESLLDDVYADIGKRTLLAAGRVFLRSAAWNADHDDVFRQCEISLENQITLPHVDPQERLSVCTDASDFIWPGVVTQIPMEDNSLPSVEQRHEPIAFLPGHFGGSSLRWSIIEKEACAIMVTIDRVH